MNKIYFQTDLYCKVRSNFQQRTGANYPMDLQNKFIEELKLFDAQLAFRTIYMMNKQDVTDSLGMNGYKQIEFENEENYLLFLMKWS